MKTLLILGARLPQIPLIQAARKRGLKVIAIDPDASSPGLALADYSYSYDLADEKTILALAREHEIDGVMTLAADYPMPTIAKVTSDMSLPGPSLAAVAKATNKRLMRTALMAAGVTCPTFAHVTTTREAIQAFTNIGGDTIFKPAMSQGGRGITRVPADADNEHIEKAFLRARKETRTDGVLIEAFVEGPEFSVETLSHQGNTTVIAVTDKVTSGPPFYVELGHSQPSRSPLSTIAQLSSMAIKAVTALGIENSGGHTEIRMAEEGPVVMEVAARLGGGFINSHLVPISTGIDLVAAAIQVALGEAPDLAPQHQGKAAAIRFISAQPGKVTRVDGISSVEATEGVEEIQIYTKLGDHLPVLENASGRPGHVICGAATPDLAIALADNAAKKIRIRTDIVLHER